MKKAITILAVCSLLLTACGQIDDTESKAETTAITVSESTTDTETSSAKEEKNTSEATTTTKKSSQTASSSSKPTGITVTTTKKSGSSGASGNSIQGQNNAVQNNNGQENYQPAQNSQQADNSPPDNNQSNNGAQQNNQSSDNKPQTTTAKPAVTNPPTTTTPKPQTTTVPQTQPPLPVPTEEERYMDIGRSLSHDDSDYGKAEAVYNWMTENGSGTCVNFSWQTYYLCKGTGLECYLAWTPSKLYGHVANVVKVNGTWFVLDTQGQGFLLNNDCGFSEIIDIDESYVSVADLISSQRYDEIY
jgi:hypothetical protein